MQDQQVGLGQRRPHPHLRDRLLDLVEQILRRHRVGQDARCRQQPDDVPRPGPVDQLGVSTSTICRPSSDCT